MTLYKAYADEVPALIDSGALVVGQRMPAPVMRFAAVSADTRGSAVREQCTP
jgi:hypothetical protein